MKSPILFVILLALQAQIAGCQDSRQDEVRAIIVQNERVREALKAAGIKEYDNVTCMRQLPPKVGASTQCASGVPGDKVKLYDVSVKSLSADGPKLHVEPAKITVRKSSLEARITDLLAKHPDGFDLESVHCPSGLSGISGDTVRCELLLPDGRRSGATATLQGLSGGFLNALFTKYTVAYDVLPEKLSVALADMLRKNPDFSSEQSESLRLTCDASLKAMTDAVTFCTMTLRGYAPTKIKVSFDGVDEKTQQVLIAYEFQ